MGKLTQKGLDALLKKPPKRWPDGEGLFFKTARDRKAYFTYRFTLNGRETETSIGPHPEMTLAEAQIKHLELRAMVLKGIDPVAKRSPKAAAPSGMPTFGQCADQHIALNEGEWKNAKHHAQWVMTLREYAAPIRDTPVDQITTADVLAVLTPIWNDKPETASRLRGRIEAVIASAQVDGHIEEGRSNPARWKNWLDRKLPKPKKLGKLDRKTGAKVKRSNHASMPYKLVPALMAKLAETPGGAALALRVTILTACRTSEVLNMTFDELDLGDATWNIPAGRMKMGLPHRVPLSATALDILRTRQEERGQNPHVFSGRPMRALSNMSMAMLLRRLRAGNVTVHGFRASFRNWATEVDKTEYSTAERCLAHVIGDDAAKSYDTSDRLELRRPIMSAWASFVCGSTVDNVVELRRTGA